MGKLTPADKELAYAVDEGTRNAVGPGAWVRVIGSTNFSLSGAFTGTVHLERSFDGGNTAIPCSIGGKVVDFTAPCSEEIAELEEGVLYRVNITVLTNGAVNWRFSR